MPHYRALRSLSGAGEIIEQGTIFDGARLGNGAIEILLEKQKIAPIYPPPLKVIPNWDEQAKVLEAANIHSVEAFLDMPDTEIAKATKTKLETVEKWRDELLTIVLK